jgi:tetratricopeptide (TPR) repeat protein
MATEYLEGQTLRAWLRAAPRARQAILDVFVQAGRGLAAAHAAGLVHRDFKPANVLVPADGRARVLDFGLARAAGGDPADEPRPPRSAGVAPDRALLETPLTLSGTVLGTPAYMSPEQHRELPTDARTDQFSFCVALWEALFGERPFGGEAYEDLRASVLAGTPREPAGAGRVPARLRRILERGLAVEPSARFPDMDALLHELASDPAVRRRRVGVGVGMAVLATTAVVALARPGDGPGPCETARDRLAGVWDQDVRARVEVAFEGTHEAFAAASLAGVVTALDGYAETWVAAHTDACEAHHVRGEQSGALLDRRMACLDARRRSLAALGALLVDADPQVVRNAVDAAQALPAVDRCADVAALERGPDALDEPDQAEAVEGVRGLVARAQALRSGGKYVDAREVAAQATTQAEALTNPGPLAEALLVSARLHDTLGDPGRAVDLGFAALAAADRAAHDELRAEILAELVWWVGHSAGRPAQVGGWQAQAAAAIDRVDRPDLLAALRMHEAVVLSDQGDHAGARARMEEALPWYERDQPESLRLAAARNRFGAILFAAGDYDGALPHYQAARDLRLAVLGPDHPVLAQSLGNIALVHFTRGEFERALHEYEAAQAILERSADPESLEVARGSINLGGVLLRLDRVAEAERHHARAVEISRRTLAPGHPLIATAVHTHGQVLARLGRRDEALAAFAEALAAWESTLGPDHPQLAHALTGAGLVHLEAGDPLAAVAGLERAHTLRSAAQSSDATLLAETDFALAQALFSDASARRRALELARTAAAAYDAGGPAHAAAAGIVHAWLEARSRRVSRRRRASLLGSRASSR